MRHPLLCPLGLNLCLSPLPYPCLTPPTYPPAYTPHTCELHRQQEVRDSADSIADLKASWGQRLAEVQRQAEEQQQQASMEAQVRLAAVQASRDKLQAQLDQTQNSNGALHKQLADAHGKVGVCVCVCVCV